MDHTTVLLVAFLVCHVAVVLNIVAISTNDWVKAVDDSIHPLNGSNDSLPSSCNKGLWKICDPDCHHIDQSQQTWQFKTVQGLFVTATGILPVALILFYLLICTSRINTSKDLLYVISIIVTVSTALSISAMIVHSVSFQHNKDFPENLSDDEKLGWSFFIAVASSATAVIGTVLSWLSARLMQRRYVGYMDL